MLAEIKKKKNFFFCVTTNTAAANQFDIYNAKIGLLFLYSNSSLFKVYVHSVCIYAPVVLLPLHHFALKRVCFSFG